MHAGAIGKNGALYRDAVFGAFGAYLITEAIYRFVSLYGYLFIRVTLIVNIIRDVLQVVLRPTIRCLIISNSMHCSNRSFILLCTCTSFCYK